VAHQRGAARPVRLERRVAPEGGQELQPVGPLAQVLAVDMLGQMRQRHQAGLVAHLLERQRQPQGHGGSVGHMLVPGGIDKALQVTHGVQGRDAVCGLVVGARDHTPGRDDKKRYATLRR
jgi:hypothetical protein